MRAGKSLLTGILMFLCLGSFQSNATEPEPEKPANPEGVKESEEPSMEMLEFLGSWETEKGQWIDPQELEEITLPEQEYGENEK